MFEFLDSLHLEELNEASIILRMMLATVFGGLLGIERTRKRRAAGFRTYMLVCIGSAVVMMTGQYIQVNLGGTDPARLGAQVISGIGFLGAGTIILTGAHQVKGLTTAAGLWTVACLGIAIGIGFYFGACIMFFILLIVMTTLEYVQSRIIRRLNRVRLYVTFESLDNITDFLNIAHDSGIVINDFETMSTEFGKGVGAVFMLKFKEKKSHAEIIETVRHCTGVTFIEEI